MTNKWKVTYMMKGSPYQEHVEVGVDLPYTVAAMAAMYKVRDANDNKLTDVTAQQVD